MINIFITYRCNLKCPYCFARDMQKEYTHDMQKQDFARLLAWMCDAGVTSAAFIGGEPTLHSNLPAMIEETVSSGIAVTLFTNGLFSPDLIPRIGNHVANFVVNYNDPGIFNSIEQYTLLHSNLAALVANQCRITFSKNFSPTHCDYAYILEGASQYGVQAIRYDISRPGESGSNDFFASSKTPEMMQKIVSFVRSCDENGIRTGLDCCAKFCEPSATDRAYLERVSMKFTGICHPSVDIHPDLSASYCLPLHDIRVADVTEFPSNERLIHHFAATVRPWRFDNVPKECSSCDDFQKKCQGGCLAIKRITPTCCAQPIQTNSLSEVAHG